MRIGIIGLDTSHGPAFARLIRERTSGFEVVAAWAGASEAIPASRERAPGFEKDFETMGIPLLASPEDVAACSDAILLLNLDGGAHRGLFERIARPGMSVFVDKPMANTVADVRTMFDYAERIGCRVFSSSALPCLPAFRKAFGSEKPMAGRLTIRAPLNTIEGVPRYHFYGIHAVELMIAALGPEWTKVQADPFVENCFEIQWVQGVVGRLEFVEPKVDNRFSIESENVSIGDLCATAENLYAPLVEVIGDAFSSGNFPVSRLDTEASIRLLEALG